jgi:hypothetical protein
MRIAWLLPALLAAGCDRQLNAEWCAQHREDQECINAGLVQIDAPKPCPEQACTMPGALACDTARGGICVQCVPGMADPSCHCASDDMCHDCLVNADCGVGGLCLSDDTCVGGGSGSAGSPDDLLYATPGGTGDCSQAMKCSLSKAISMVTSARQAIELDAGTYHEGPLTITQSMVLIGPSPGSGHVYQDPTDATGRAVITGAASGPVISVTGGMVALFELTIAGSPDNAGITCNAATVQLYHDVIRDNPHEGINASACPLTIERSVFENNATTGQNYEAIFANNSGPIAIRNNFVYGNGNSHSVNGAVHFAGSTAGDFRFNSVGFNHALPRQGNGNGNGNDFSTSSVGGVLCDASMVTVRDNVISRNDTTDFAFTQNGCQPTNSYIGGDPVFQSSTDLHLTAASPQPAIVNNSASDCTYAKGYDIDFDARPMGGVCDLGADESR